MRSDKRELDWFVDSGSELGYSIQYTCRRCRLCIETSIVRTLLYPFIPKRNRQQTHPANAKYLSCNLY